MLKQTYVPMLAGCFLLIALSCSAQDSKIIIEKLDGSAEIKFGDQPFANFVFDGHAKPILYPLHGPGGVAMTRNYPMVSDVEGEAKDHPHHKSVWFAHGDVNGHDFWSEKANIVMDDITINDDGRSISGISRWVARNKILCTERTTIAFHVGDDDRWRAVDYHMVLKPTDEDVTMGDTKEGTFAVRTHPALRIVDAQKNPAGNAINSEGIEGRAIWGKNARWVYYTGKIDGEEMGLAIFDHPKNFRHPTTWHAREYGLIGANPFGLHHFTGAEKGTGNLVIKVGQQQDFRYRILLTDGAWPTDQIEENYTAWAK